jgi:hypothetical protein
MNVLFDNILTKKISQILLVGSNALVLEHLRRQIISLNGIETVYTFGEKFDGKELEDILRGQTRDAKPILVCFEDCNIANNNYYKRVLLNGRHLNIFSITAMKYPVGIKEPEIRWNYDLVFVCKIDISYYVCKIYDYFFDFMGRERFKNLIAKLEDDECLCKKNGNELYYCVKFSG